MTKSRWIGLGIGVMLILAAFGLVALQTLAIPVVQNVASAQAAGETPTPAPTATTSSIGDTFWAALAAKLGVNVDTLKADALQVRKDMLDQAVKDGLIAQAQADQLKQQLDSNKLIAPIYIGPGAGRFGPGFRGPGGGQPLPRFRGRGYGTLPAPGVRGPGFGFGFGATELEAVAKSLNMASADLVTQLRGGKTLADVAKAQNVDQSVVKQAIITAHKAEIDREVADGLLTQAQATALEARLTPDNIDLTRRTFFIR